MNLTEARKITLKEYVPSRFPDRELTKDEGELLWRKFGNVLAVESPSFMTEYQWVLISQGWVGQIPLSENLVLYLTPRIELGNLFRMWEYAYRLNSFKFLEGLVQCGSLEEFYEQLANVLARRILDRARKGFYRDYIPENEVLPYLRGRMDIRRALARPWQVKLHCHYEDHTGDIEDNQILAWTMRRIARSGLCSGRVLPNVRAAYRSLQGFVTLRSFNAESCIGRMYHRLNEDYHPLHALCTFFLDTIGPIHDPGDREMLPFLVNMPRLFELFVAEWLQVHLPKEWEVKAQERLQIDDSGNFEWIADLILYKAKTGDPYCIIDTKYKVGPKPSNVDINEVLAIAEAKQCNQAVLIYPAPLEIDIDQLIGDIKVQSLSFSLDGDLLKNGYQFLDRLLINEARHN